VSGHVIAGSRIGRVREFYERNPDEGLTAADMQVKFHADKKQVDKIIHVMRHAGYLTAKAGTSPVLYMRTGIAMNQARWRPQK
jgi:hypothetical protein